MKCRFIYIGYICCRVELGLYHRLTVFENRVTGGCSKLLNEELHNLYSSPDIIRMIKTRNMRWTGHKARMGEKRNAYSILVGKPEGKRSLGRPRRRWVDNIKIDIREIGWHVWIGLIWLRIGTGGGLL
jgi:hypothetical protein